MALHHEQPQQATAGPRTVWFPASSLTWLLLFFVCRRHSLHFWQSTLTSPYGLTYQKVWSLEKQRVFITWWSHRPGIYGCVIVVTCNILCSFTLMRTASEVSMWLLWSTNAVKMNCSSWVWITTPRGRHLEFMPGHIYLHCAATVTSLMLYDNPAT